MKPSRVLIPLIAAATFCSINTSSAILTWDLRAVQTASLNDGTPVSTTAGVVLDPKSVQIDPGATGGLVTFELWAVVTGLNATVDETLVSGIGMITSGPGPNATPQNLDTGVAGNTALSLLPNGLRGNLSNEVLQRWRATGTTSNGLVLDIDGDGDLDVGNTNLGGTSNFIVVNGGGAQSGGTPGVDFNTLPNGREWKISIATFSITQILGSSVGVNFVVPRFTSSLNENARASFATDGVTRNGADAQLAVAGPVVLTVIPEPSAFGMLLLGAMGLVGFRRLGMRKN